jgi:predicted  nucleic acid-binding Zn-ribbon protein
MKNTTQKIYNIITMEIFENIDKLKQIVKEKGWSVPERNEYTFEELLEDLPTYINIIKDTIESGEFDKLKLDARNSFYRSINNIKNALQNTYNGNNQITTLMDNTQYLGHLIRTCVLDFRTHTIPEYWKKLKEFNELNEKLKDFIKKMEITQNNIEEFNKIYEEIKQKNDKSNQMEKEISQLLNKSSENKKQIDKLKEESTQRNNEMAKLLNETKELYKDIKYINEKSNDFFNRVDEYIKKMNEKTEFMEEQIETFKRNTEDIINRNEELTKEIEEQLQKATGVSLFHTFEKRKNELYKGLNWWKVGVFFFGLVLLSISLWIFNDLKGENFNSSMFLLKITIATPLVYLLYFTSSRYTKERRLIEEYAFKSTISLALKPYIDLVKKIEEDGADGKYKDLLIKSIEDIFQSPTDKVFSPKHDEGKEENKSNIISMIGKIMEELSSIKKDMPPKD